MLTRYAKTAGTDLPAWIDLLDPTEAEAAEVAERLGAPIPSRRELERIDASSRLSAKDETLRMSAPLISGTATERWQMAPVGFLLSSQVLVTVRFAELESFDAVSDGLGADDALSAPAIFTRLLEALVDRAADHLEHASDATCEAAQRIFFDDNKRQRLKRDTAMLRGVMREMGRVSDRASRARYAFLSIGRMADFALDRCTPKLDGDVRERLEAVRRDIASLDEFEASLTDRIQFMLDSAVGFISIEQNDVFKVLTVASVVGIPPVLVVGVYGMNFKNMPELSWHLGYPYALLLCVVSMVVPLIWFKWRDWL